ncbi:MAG: hypothetical protein ACI9G1_000381 [Pirellulaceae bacterium]|jgi:uncharacterized protein YkwD
MKTLASVLAATIIALVVSISSDPLKADSLTSAQMAQLRRQAATLKRETNPTKRAATTAELIKWGKPAVEILIRILDEELDELLANAEVKAAPAAWLEQVELARARMKKLRDDEELSQDMIKESGDPTMDTLHLLYANQQRPLDSQRAKLTLLIRQFATLTSFYEQLNGTEAGKALEAAARLELVEGTKEGLDKDAAQKIVILEQNKVIGANLAPEIAAGIVELNQARMMLGLDPLRIDPKLCAAAEGHSNDMVAYDFFEHESLVPGKRNFTDRAKLEGTTASGENIYRGSTQPSSALKGWYYSPPHHKNMFSDKHERVGLGRKDNRWTLMFGR